MQSVLIVSQNRKSAGDYIIDLCEKEEINVWDKNVNDYEKAMGIEDVRNIYKQIILKPFKSKTKAVIIHAYESITTEAQNALLKILEEPPSNTIIIIAAQKKELLLETILSRCKIIELKEEDIAVPNEDISIYNSFLDIFFNGKVRDRLKAAQDIERNKEGTIAWLSKMSIFARKKMLEDYKDSRYWNLLKALQKTYSVVKSTNVNQRIALESLFLSF